VVKRAPFKSGCVKFDAKKRNPKGSISIAVGATNGKLKVFNYVKPARFHY